MKIVVVGGVAGGASAAARARRLMEDAEIVVFERGEHISYANCGLPYHVGNVIPDEDDLLVQTVKGMSRRFRLDIRTNSEVTAIHRDRRTVSVHDHRDGRSYEESYDRLILSPGARPFVPPLPGADLEGVYTLRTIPDAAAIKAKVDEGNVKRAVVVGAGFIGVELAENLQARGVEVFLEEGADQVLPPLDSDMARLVETELENNGVQLLLGSSLKSIEKIASGLAVTAGDHAPIETDLVALCIGVRPETELAQAAGLRLGLKGSIWTDSHQRTSDPYIYAVGDAVQTWSLLGGKETLLALAGPANRQGRLAAGAIAGLPHAFPGVVGSSVVKVFGLTAAVTGMSEKALLREKVPYEKVYVQPLNHAGYYPGARQMTLKLLFSPVSRRVLGAQAVGREGVDKRIDVIATALQLGATVDQLSQLELCYAPPYGSAKDPVNVAGFVAVNVLDGLSRQIHWHDIGCLPKNALLLDVRTPAEYEAGHIEGAKLYPLDSLRETLEELPKDRPTVVYCKVGLRGYLAERILVQHGFTDVYNLAGGYQLYEAVQGAAAPELPIDCLGYARS